MIINYLGENIVGKKSIFLAGPTPKNKQATSWRTEAIEILKKLKFDGIVYVPELANGDKIVDKIAEKEWETEVLKDTSVIIFWVPGEVREMLTLLTDYDFGVWYDFSKVFYGRPKDVKMQYLDYKYCRYSKRLPCDNLNELLEEAVNELSMENILMNNTYK